jgi:hypothetical protein
MELTCLAFFFWGGGGGGGEGWGAVGLYDFLLFPMSN